MTDQRTAQPPWVRPPWRDVPRGVWILGLVSLFMDISSELIHALLPLLLVDRLGVGVAVVGAIEGIAEATSAVTRLFSGALSDRIGRRKLLAALGYGLGAASKPLFPLAGSAATILGARFIDRVGKGIRGAPRDALVADLTPAPLRGAAYGLRQSLDSIGAFAGPLLAILLMAAYGGQLRSVLWWASLPAWIAVALVVFAVHEPRHRPEIARERPRSAIRRRDLAALGRGYWIVVGIGAVFTLARFSEAFLILDGQAAGLRPTLVPLVMVCMNAAYALASAPAGMLSDRIGRRSLLAAGMLVLVAADLVLARAAGLGGLFAGAALWGLHMALTQGLLAAFIADRAPPERRGTAFGMFHLVTGGSLLLASSAAGLVWQVAGPGATFLLGAALALASFLILSFGMEPAGQTR